MISDLISTGLGDYSRDKFSALIDIRAIALEAICDALKNRGYTQVTTSSLVNIAGSCENPHASFKVDYYGRMAHLSQSAQLQLEALVMRLKRGFFTVNNSFREETYTNPASRHRRLSEFTLIEPERPYEGLNPQEALDRMLEEEEQVIKHTVQKVLDKCARQVTVLGGNVAYLEKVIDAPFLKISYDDALGILNSHRDKKYKFGKDFGIKDELQILAYFDNLPVFVAQYPAHIKFFNMKRTPDGRRVYNADLLMPKLGEASGGAVREEDIEAIRKQLETSRMASLLRAAGTFSQNPFAEYFRSFEGEIPLLRVGYGIGYERLVGFLIGTDDILSTMTPSVLHPRRR